METDHTESEVPSQSDWLRAVLHLAVFIGASLGFVFVLVTVTPLVSWWAAALAGPWEDPSGEVLIVVGGSVLDNGVIGTTSYWRGVYAAEAWKGGEFRQVILSGGGPEKISVAEAMRDFLECRGVPPAVIRLEPRSNSTRENALYTRELLAGVPGHKVLLTSDYHMFRAQRAFRKAGLDVLPRPLPDARKRAAHWLGRWPAFLDLVVETLKIGYYYVRGWI